MHPFDAITVTLNPAIDRTITIPGFKPGTVNRVESMRDTAGGKGINVASALASAGFKIAATGFLGHENLKIFKALFAAKTIADQFIHINGETRIGIKIVDPTATATTDINFPGLSPNPESLSSLRHRLETLEAPWFILGGSIPPNVAPAIYRDFIRLLQTRGKNIVLDTSGEPLKLALEARPTIIKPNLHELETLLGKSLPNIRTVLAAAQNLIQRGIQMVVVSMGKEGACFVTQEKAVIVHPPEIQVRSTVGAGDAMVAGIVSAQIQKLPLEDCARLGTAFSVEMLTRNQRTETNFTAATADILPHVSVTPVEKAR